jgi:hypothetical protein
VSEHLAPRALIVVGWAAAICVVLILVGVL